MPTYPDADSRANVQQENRFHDYVGNRIPWYVRLIWVLFWCFAIYYTIAYLFPAIRVELLSPP